MSRQAPPPPSVSMRLLYAGCVLVILAHVAGYFVPTHATWGVHFFGFFSGGMALAALAIAAGVLVPPVNAAVGNALDALAKKASGWPSRYTRRSTSSPVRRSCS